jgi:predicted site-specific integrase-resolvase
MAFKKDAIALAQRTSAEFACEKLGISRKTLDRWVQSRPAPRRTFGYSQEEREEVIAWAKETSIRNAAEEYSIPEITVRRWVKPPPPEIVRKAHRRYNASALGKERKRRYRERIKSVDS